MTLRSLVPLAFVVAAVLASTAAAAGQTTIAPSPLRLADAVRLATARRAETPDGGSGAKAHRVGTNRFSSSLQCWTTTMVGGNSASSAPLPSLIMTNRRPSADAAYIRPLKGPPV